MTIPSYAYLKLKIPGPTGIIAMEAKVQRALDYEQVSIVLAAAMVTTTELKELNLSAPPSSTNPAMPSMSSTFKVVKDAKAMQIDAEDPAKTDQIRVDLSPK
jgi:hypothetical protein